MRLSPLREFALKALLWLPLSFVCWFVLAPLLVWPVGVAARAILVGVWPDLFSGLVQGGQAVDHAGQVLGRADYLLEVTTTVLVRADEGGRVGLGVLETTVNPMVYGYALPLFSGLTLATPMPVRRRLLQLIAAFAVIWLAQSFGVVAESLKIIAFQSGPPGLAAAQKAGLEPNVIALVYQFGYLILPALVPVALWVGFNRTFIESLVGSPGEPGDGKQSLSHVE